MKKRFVPLILVFVMLLTLGANAAAESRATGATPELSFSETTANCSVTITSPTKKIEAALSLWDGNTLIDSWSGSGTTVLVITGSTAVVDGRTYTLKVSGTIGGVAFEGTPISRTC